MRCLHVEGDAGGSPITALELGALPAAAGMMLRRAREIEKVAS